MSANNNQESQPIQYPDISSSTPPPPPPPSSVSPPPQPYGHETTPNPLPGPSSSATASPAHDEKWGTHVMGTPAVPTCHPNNQKAALWGVADQKDYQNHHQPYIQYNPINTNTNSSGSVLQKFNSWSAKAEVTANNIWHNRMHLDFSVTFSCYTRSYCSHSLLCS